LPDRPFIPAMDLNLECGFYIINLIAKRGVRTEITEFLKGKGFMVMRDFILAA